MGMLATRQSHANSICSVQVSTRTAPRALRIRRTLAAHSLAATAAECSAAAQEIATALRSQLPCQWLVEGGGAFDFELANIVEGLEAISPFGYPSDPPHLALDDLNELMAKLFDWADESGIKLTL